MRPFSRLPWLALSDWKRWSALALAYVGLFALWLVVWPAAPETRLAAGRLMLVVPQFLAGGFAFSLARRGPSGHSLGLETGVRQAWGLIALGIWLWLAASLIRLYFELALRAPPPLPTFGDPLQLAGSFFVAAGLIAYPTMPRERFGRIRLYLDVAIATVAGVMLSWLVVLRPTYLVTSARLATSLWTMVYPLADFTLLFILVNILLISESDRSRRALSFVALGLLALIAGDVAQAYFTLQNQQGLTGLITLGWLVGNSLLGLGALFQIEPPSGLPSSLSWLERLRLRRRIQPLLPLAATVVLGWYTVLDWRAVGQIDLLSVWTTALLGMALIARQGVAIGEVELLNYAHLVNTSADPAFICGHNGRLRLVNPALLAATGYDHEQELVGKPLTMLLALSTLHPDEDLRGERLLEVGWSGEVSLSRKDGSEFPAYLSLRPVHSLALSRPTLAGTAHDLTQVKQQQASLRAAYEQVAEARHELETLNAQLEQKVAEETRNLSEANARLARQYEDLQTLDRLKSDFVSLVSHELRAPLTTVNGGIELLLSDPEELPPTVRGALTLVQVQINRLTQFVETILDLSALEAGRLPLYPAPLALNRLIASLQELFAAGPAGDRIKVRMPASVRPALADERGLTSVIFHLIDNAIKYAPVGQIDVEVESDDDWVWVHVTDHGPGLPPNAEEKIFQKFERLNSDDSRSVYGHGLGLYMSRRLLQAMGGDIRAGNMPEGGARFTFWLPAVKGEANDDDE